MDAKVTREKSRANQRRYSSDEVADIIRLSLQDEKRHGSDDTIDYDELLAIARDVGVDVDQVDRAVELLEEEQRTREKEQKLWLRFKAHALLFAAVTLLLIVINLFGGGTESFRSMYVVFGWGLFVLGHYAGLRYAPEFVDMAMQRTRELASNKYQNLFDSENQVLVTTSDPMGMTETSGMIRLEDDHLILEYQTVDAVLGVIKTGVKTVQIPINQLASARIEQKLWSAELVLKGKTMRAFNNAPGAARGQLRVKLNRQSLTAANDLIDNINTQLQSS